MNRRDEGVHPLRACDRARNDPRAACKRIRAARGWSQERLARELGVSWAAVQAWESATNPRRPGSEIIYRALARLLQEGAAAEGGR